MVDLFPIISVVAFFLFLCHESILETWVKVARIKAGLDEDGDDYFDDEDHMTDTLFVQQCDTVEFSDLSALNGALLHDARSNVKNLITDDMMADPRWSGWIIQTHGEVDVAEIVDDQFQGYNEMSPVRDEFNLDDATIIAEHMITGKLVFRVQDDEGCTFYVMTPGQAKSMDVSELKF